MQSLIEIFSYGFMARALLVGGLISLCSALLGVSLVLKRYSMIGDGLSHVGFGALAVSMAVGFAPLAVAVPTVIVAAFLLLRIGNKSGINGDAAVALISTGALAVGIIAVSLKGGMNVDVMNYMFGSILAIEKTEVLPIVICCVVIIVLFAIFYNRIFLVTCDENFARANGNNTGLFNAVIAVFTAVIIVMGMKLLGSLLISSLIIFPPIASMRVFKTFKSVTVFSAIFGVVCFVGGLTASFYLSLPAGATVVVVNIIGLLIMLAVGFFSKIKSA